MKQRSRVMAVDDDAMNRIVMMEYLEEDYDVVVVASGEECLDTIVGFRPDVVLLDIMMPGLNGYEVCERIKADPRTRHVKVILVSAKAMLEERLEGYEAGADDYVTKPFSGDELCAKLDVYLKLRSVEEVDDLKGQFLGLLSHETRTPLTAIVTPASLLAMELEDDPEKKEYVDLVLQGARRLESMIERALALCEYKSGKALLQRTTVDLGAVVDAAIEARRETIDAQGVQVKRGSASGLEIEADGEAMREALDGVFRHAIGRGAEEASLEVAWRPSSEDVELQIRATEPHVDDAWLPHLFEDFYVPSLDNHTGVLDLDLALAGAIVRMHEGTIDAEFDAARSLVYRIRLPRKPAQVEDATPDPALSAQ